MGQSEPFTTTEREKLVTEYRYLMDKAESARTGMPGGHQPDPAMLLDTNNRLHEMSERLKHLPH